MISRRDRELLTPHKVSVLIFIDKYGRCHGEPWGSSQDVSDVMFDQSRLEFDSQSKKAICVLTAKLLQGSDMTLSQMIQLIQSSQIPQQLMQNFLSGLKQVFTVGIEAFISLFDSIERHCEQDQSRMDSYPCLWTSLAGLHIRHMSLAFRRLSFHYVVILYQKFYSYFNKCKEENPEWLLFDDVNNKQSLDFEMNDIDKTDVSMDIGSTSANFIDDRKLIEDELNENEIKTIKTIPKLKHSQISTRHQAENFIQEQLCYLINEDPEALSPPQLQTILNSLLKNCPDLGKGHFLSYLNCLRMKEFTGAIHSLVRAYDSKIIQKDPSRGEDITKTFRYAALNMAGLQSTFGHNNMSLLALEEAIRLAQESNDHMCLQYALSWLYTLTTSDNSVMMKLSHDRSKDLDFSYLTWLSQLNHTVELSKQKALPSILLQNIFGKITFGHNQEQHTMEGGVAGQAGVWSVQAALWTLWGNLCVSSICSQLVLHMQPQMNFTVNTPLSVSPTCTSVCNMALYLANMGEYSLASSILRHAQSRFPSPSDHSKQWLFSQAYIGFYEALYEGLWPQASVMADSMATTHPTQAQLLKAEMLVAKGEYTLALKITATLRKTSLSCDTRVKMIIIEGQAQAGGNNPGAALSTLAEAVSAANEYHLAYLAAIANLQLASIQMHLKLLQQAKMNLRKGLIVILSGGGIVDNARAKLLSAKLETLCSKGDNRMDCLKEVADKLEEVRQLFQKIKAYGRVKETLYLKARLYNECKCTEERNKSAYEYRKFEEEYPNVHFTKNTMLL